MTVIKKTIKLTLLISLFGHGTHLPKEKHIEVERPCGRRQSAQVVIYDK